jgi:hypothetical protein
MDIGKVDECVDDCASGMKEVNGVCECKPNYSWFEEDKKCVKTPCKTLNPETPVRLDFDDTDVDGCKKECDSTKNFVA